jgi:DNA-binding PadR family transcriptional regulator
MKPKHIIVLTLIPRHSYISVNDLSIKIKKHCKENQGSMGDLPCNKRTVHSILNPLEKLRFISSYTQQKQAPEKFVSLTERGKLFLLEIFDKISEQFDNLKYYEIDQNAKN